MLAVCSWFLLLQTLTTSTLLTLTIELAALCVVIAIT